jgi:hypothetical protein
MPPPGRHEPHAEEAAALLEHPDFFCDFAQSPSDLKFTDQRIFQFQSQISTPWDENNLVRGKLAKISNRHFVARLERRDRLSLPISVSGEIVGSSARECRSL